MVNKKKNQHRFQTEATYKEDQRDLSKNEKSFNYIEEMIFNTKQNFAPSNNAQPDVFEKRAQPITASASPDRNFSQLKNQNFNPRNKDTTPNDRKNQNQLSLTPTQNKHIQNQKQNLDSNQQDNQYQHTVNIHHGNISQAQNVSNSPPSNNENQFMSDLSEFGKKTRKAATNSNYSPNQLQKKNNGSSTQKQQMKSLQSKINQLAQENTSALNSHRVNTSQNKQTTKPRRKSASKASEQSNNQVNQVSALEQKMYIESIRNMNLHRFGKNPKKQRTSPDASAQTYEEYPYSKFHNNYVSPSKDNEKGQKQASPSKLKENDENIPTKRIKHGVQNIALYQEIQRFMDSKRKKLDEDRFLKQREQRERRQKLMENLFLLKREIREKFQKKQKSLKNSPQRDVNMSKSKDKFSQVTGQINNISSEHSHIKKRTRTISTPEADLLLNKQRSITTNQKEPNHINPYNNSAGFERQTDTFQKKKHSSSISKQIEEEKNGEDDDYSATERQNLLKKFEKVAANSAKTNDFEIRNKPQTEESTFFDGRPHNTENTPENQKQKKQKHSSDYELKQRKLLEQIQSRDQIISDATSSQKQSSANSSQRQKNSTQMEKGPSGYIDDYSNKFTRIYRDYEEESQNIHNKNQEEGNSHLEDSGLNRNYISKLDFSVPHSRNDNEVSRQGQQNFSNKFELEGNPPLYNLSFSELENMRKNKVSSSGRSFKNSSGNQTGSQRSHVGSISDNGRKENFQEDPNAIEENPSRRISKNDTQSMKQLPQFDSSEKPSILTYNESAGDIISFRENSNQKSLSQNQSYINRYKEYQQFFEKYQIQPARSDSQEDFNENENQEDLNEKEENYQQKGNPSQDQEREYEHSNSNKNKSDTDREPSFPRSKTFQRNQLLNFFFSIQPKINLLLAFAFDTDSQKVSIGQDQRDFEDNYANPNLKEKNPIGVQVDAAVSQGELSEQQQKSDTFRNMRFEKSIYLLEFAATLIQKIFRGYLVRRDLREFYQQIQREIEDELKDYNNDPEFDDDMEIDEIKKKAAKIIKPRAPPSQNEYQHSEILNNLTEQISIYQNDSEIKDDINNYKFKKINRVNNVNNKNSDENDHQKINYNGKNQNEEYKNQVVPAKHLNDSSFKDSDESQILQFINSSNFDNVMKCQDDADDEPKQNGKKRMFELPKRKISQNNPEREKIFDFEKKDPIKDEVNQVVKNQIITESFIKEIESLKSTNKPAENVQQEENNQEDLSNQSQKIDIQSDQQEINAEDSSLQNQKIKQWDEVISQLANLSMNDENFQENALALIINLKKQEEIQQNSNGLDQKSNDFDIQAGQRFNTAANELREKYNKMEIIKPKEINNISNTSESPPLSVNNQTHNDNIDSELQKIQYNQIEDFDRIDSKPDPPSQYQSSNNNIQVYSSSYSSGSNINNTNEMGSKSANNTLMNNVNSISNNINNNNNSGIKEAATTVSKNSSENSNNNTDQFYAIQQKMQTAVLQNKRFISGESEPNDRSSEKSYDKISVSNDNEISEKGGQKFNFQRKTINFEDFRDQGDEIFPEIHDHIENFKKKKAQNVKQPQNLNDGDFDLSEFRMTLVSEKDLQKQFQTLSSQNSSAKLSHGPESNKVLGGGGDSGSFIFQNQSFKQFTSNQFQKMLMKRENMDDLFKMREEALASRHRAQRQIIEKMFDSKRVSPQSFKRKINQLQTWVSKEKEKLKNTRQEIEKGWEVFSETIRQTKKDISLMQKFQRQLDLSQLSNNEEINRQLLQFRSESSSQPSDLEIVPPDSSLVLDNQHKYLNLNNNNNNSGNQANNANVNKESQNPDFLRDFLKKQNNYVINLDEGQHFEVETDSVNKVYIGDGNDDWHSKGVGSEDLQTFDRNSGKRNIEKKDLVDLNNKNKTAQKELQDNHIQNREEQKNSNYTNSIEAVEDTNSLQESGYQENSERSMSDQGHIFRHSQSDGLRNKYLDSFIPNEKNEFLDHNDIEIEDNIPVNGSENNILQKRIFISDYLDSSQELMDKNGQLEIEQLCKEIVESLVNDTEADLIQNGLKLKSEANQYYNDDLELDGYQIYTPINEPPPDDDQELGDLDKYQESGEEESKVFKKESSSSTEKVQEIKNDSQLSNKKAQKIDFLSLNFVRDFLIAFADFLKTEQKQAIMKALSVPIGIDPQDFLKTFNLAQTLLSGSNSEQTHPAIYPLIKYIQVPKPIISEELFAQFYIDFRQRVDPQNTLATLDQNQQFHMKLIYTCYNEALDQFRPFGSKGKPLPWQIKAERLVIKPVSENDLQKILSISIAKVLKWGSCLCGFIPERIEGPNGEIIHIDDDYLAQIQEDRLAHMLEAEVLENEDKWLQYDEEETEVQLEVGESVLDFLINEFVRELKKDIKDQSQMTQEEKAALKKKMIIDNFKKSLAQPSPKPQNNSQLNTSF